MTLREELHSQLPELFTAALGERSPALSAFVTPDGRIHFKHTTLGYAYATLNDLFNDCLILRSKTGIDEYRFAEVEALLLAGWAID